MREILIEENIRLLQKKERLIKKFPNHCLEILEKNAQLQVELIYIKSKLKRIKKEKKHK